MKNVGLDRTPAPPSWKVLWEGRRVALRCLDLDLGVKNRTHVETGSLADLA